MASAAFLRSMLFSWEISVTIIAATKRPARNWSSNIAESEFRLKILERLNMRTDSFLSGLNERQRAAVTVRDQHAIVFAGAGTGKTRTIIARAAYLIANGVSPTRICILAFTRKAAAEIVERVHSQLGGEASHLHATTFHSWCNGMLRRAPALFGRVNFTIVDRADEVMLFQRLRGKRKRGEFPKAATISDIYSFARNTRRTIAESIGQYWSAWGSCTDEILEICAEYEARKQEARYVDYDDLLEIVVERLSGSEDARKWLSRTYDHILIDEMQDTNPLQWEVLDAVKEFATLYCVGDDAQSIYGFRGADFNSIHRFTARVTGALEFKLVENYRSTQEILDVANWLLAQSPMGYDRRLQSVRGRGNRPVLRTFPHEWKEGDWIAADLSERRRHGAPWNSHLVLVRSAYTARGVESALLEKGIPYQFVGGSKLLQAAHIRDLFSALRIVVNPHDEIAWTRYLNLWNGVGEATSSRLVGRFMNVERLECCLGILEEDRKVPATALTPLMAAQGQAHNVFKAIATVYRILESRLEELYQNENWDKRKRDFVVVAKLAERRRSVREFIDEYVLDPVHSSQGVGVQNEDMVTIATIHSAKGMEADVCYVLNVTEGVFPSPREESVEEVEEERRVLYVALTRARNELIMTRRQVDSSLGESGYDSDASERVKKARRRYFFRRVPKGLFEKPRSNPVAPPLPFGQGNMAYLVERGMGSFKKRRSK